VCIGGNFADLEDFADSAGFIHRAVKNERFARGRDAVINDSFSAASGISLPFGESNEIELQPRGPAESLRMKTSA
jgi:hypothetical protein